MQLPYSAFFQKITNKEILPYQERYGRNPFESTLLVVPTGLGKTDTVLLPWLYAHACGDPNAPKRLFVVLPRQNLTIQTASIARMRVADAGLESRVEVLELMSGSQDNDEKLRPHVPTIVVSTQDMYFSRALNRGYARRPPRWPIDFALYNQDCLIVLDEIQLMDDALATSRQLDAFREEFGTYGKAPCIWMSATVNESWLRTVDSQTLPARSELQADDLATPLIAKRLGATKLLKQAPEECREPRGCAAFAVNEHRPGTRTLIIVNTVPRAREIFAAVKSQFPAAVLVHSRFRPADRKRAASALAGAIHDDGQIIVSTQVLEAGVDITARLLVTDIAPWGSLVQRFGRVNRYGDDVDAEIYWVDQPRHSKQKDSTAPYRPEEIARALETVSKLGSASPANLPAENGPEPWTHVLRRSDLMDLFDTTPELSGIQMDVSRFIRASEDKDGYLAWRDWEGDGAPPASLAEVADAELCPVPLGELRDFMGKHPVYVWNFATERWERAERDALYAGMRGVVRTTEGGYTEQEGWSPESKARVGPLETHLSDTEGDSSDRKTYQNYRQTLRAHSERVAEEVESLLHGLGLEGSEADALRAAAARHDWGKVHPVFQATLHRSDSSPDLLAKQCRSRSAHERKHFRHELASALAMLHSGESNLACYLVAAHHGKIRVGIRSMPGETEADQTRTARGIREGDWLPSCQLTAGVLVPPVQLSLEVMEFGAEGGSWTERVLRLRDQLGPFRLAFLEMLLRVADEEASEHPGLEITPCIQ